MRFSSARPIAGPKDVSPFPFPRYTGRGGRVRRGVLLYRPEDPPHAWKTGTDETGF